MRVALCALALLSVPRLAAAEDARPLAGYRISSWMEEDGLPAGTISALAQDADGFLWLGTDAGLIRFDGARFRTWDELGGASLPPGAVSALTIARDGSLWLGIGEGRIARIRRRDVRTFPLPGAYANAPVTSLIEDGNGTVWAAAAQGLLQLTGESWAPAVAQPESPIVGFSRDGAGALYVATATAFYRHGTDGDFHRVGDNHRLVQGFAVSSDGSLWVTDRNAGFLSVGEAGATPGAVDGKGYRLLFDRLGNMWVATFGQGVWRVRLGPDHSVQQVESVTDFQGLSSNVAMALLEDRSGNIWVGTPAGLNRLAPQRVAAVPDLGVVTGVAASGESVWSNAADGLTRLERIDGEWRARPMAGERVHAEAMDVDQRGRLWIGNDRGVERWTLDAGVVRRERMSSALRTVKSITSGADGTVWILDMDLGLHVWRDGRLEPSPLAGALQQRRVASIYADRLNRLWLAIPGQSLLAVIDPNGQLREYGPADGYAAGFARTFFEDRDGVLWIAGSLGLARLTQGGMATLKREQHLPVDSLTSIAQDRDGRLWIGTAAGILRITPADFDAAIAERWDDVSATTFDAADGVAGTTGWVGQPSATRTSDGRLWFLTVTGLSAIDPSAMQDLASPSSVRVDVISLDDRRMPVSADLRIPPDVSRLQIEFTLPTLSPAQQTRFRYRLDGFDTGWINSGRLRTAIYTNLPPRAYHFRVQQQDPNGTWRDQQADWRFSVQPAFYQTLWFLALGLTATAALGWSAWRFRVAQVRRQLAIVHGERARLSRELHDTLLQSLVGVALQCDALANAPDHATVSHGLTALRRQVEGYVRECRQSLWNLRSPMLEDKDLPSALVDVGGRLAKAAGMRFDVDVAGVSRPAPGRIDEQLLRIAQEAVANAARHSGGQRVSLTLDYRDTSVRLTVSDDGRGFDPGNSIHAASGHWGLVGMEERAHTVNGTLTISSCAGAGTQIDVTIPWPQVETGEADRTDQGAVHGRPSHRSRRHRPDHQPAA